MLQNCDSNVSFEFACACEHKNISIRTDSMQPRHSESKVRLKLPLERMFAKKKKVVDENLVSDQFHTHPSFFLTFCRFAKIYKLQIFKNLSFAKTSTCEILKNLPFAKVSICEIRFFQLAKISTLKVVGQSLLQTSAGVSKWDNWDIVEQVLQSRAASRYYKIGQKLLGN